MRRLTLVAWITGALLCAPVISAQGNQRATDSARAAAFDRLDRNSRTLLATVNCARRSARARSSGLLGPIDSLGTRGQCLWIANKPFGVFFTPDSTFTIARRFRVVDLEKQAVYSAPVDTAAILAEARAMSDGVRKAYQSFQKAQRSFAPLSFRSDGDSIEVWLIPLGSIMGGTATTVGGERGYIYSPNGRKLVREIDAFDRYRTIAVADSGQAQIISREDDLPLFSELIVANLLHGDGREVQITTAAYASRLTGREPNSVWMQVHKR